MMNCKTTGVKIVTKPSSIAPPHELAQAHRNLITAFTINLILGVLRIVLKNTDVSPVAALILVIISLAANVYLCYVLYVAARKIGFGKPTAILSIVLSFFIGLLGLILVVSADLRLSKLLKAKGWKVGLLGAKLA